MHNYELKKVSLSANELSPEPFEHWTIKEIHEQYEASIRAISFGGRLVSDDLVRLGGLSQHETELKQAEHLILLGCGTSLNAAKHSVQYFKDLTNLMTVTAIDGSEFMASDIPLHQESKTIAVFLSQSGETKDLYRALKICKSQNVLLTIGVVNVVDSLIAREVDCGCYLNAGREVGVASTKAFTSQVVILSMIAINFSQIHNINKKKRKHYINSLRQLSQNIREVINSAEDSSKSIAKILVDKTDMFILGKGPIISVAEEAALKTKEIGYIHSEAYGGNALRHGPYALIESGTPIVFLCPTDSSFINMMDNESYFNLINNTIEEVKSREALTIMVTDSEYITSKVDHIIKIPNNPHYQGVLCNIPMQLIAYYLSVFKGNNPDKPRHLSKCVSV
jgi:glucosamine--fructose-6-phosphate aminotransferase (isomerizing)